MGYSKHRDMSGARPLAQQDQTMSMTALVLSASVNMFDSGARPGPGLLGMPRSVESPIPVVADCRCCAGCRDSRKIAKVC